MVILNKKQDAKKKKQNLITFIKILKLVNNETQNKPMIKNTTNKNTKYVRQSK
jgi:hypothetical protein